MIFSILIRGSGALISFLSMAFIISMLGLDMSGEYFKNIAYSMILATFMSFGMNGVVVKYAQVTTSDDWFKLKKFLIQFSQTVLLVSLIFFIISSFVYLDFWICLMSIVFAMAQMLHVFLIAKGHVNFSYGVFNVFPHFFITLFIWLNPDFIYLYYFLIYCIAFLIMILFVFIKVNKDKPFSNKVIKGWNLNERFDFFQQEFLGQSFTSISLVLVSFNLSNANVATFNIYQKLASVCNIILSVLNQSRLSLCLKYLSSKNFEAIQSESKTIFMKSSIILFLYVISVFILWDIMMGYMVGKNAVDIFPFLILCLTYSVVGYSNISTYILNSYNHAKYVRNVSYLSFFVGLLLFVVLPMYFEILGAVIASCIILINQALLTKLKFVKVTNAK